MGMLQFAVDGQIETADFIVSCLKSLFYPQTFFLNFFDFVLV